MLMTFPKIKPMYYMKPALELRVSNSTKQMKRTANTRSIFQALNLSASLPAKIDPGMTTRLLMIMNRATTLLP